MRGPGALGSGARSRRETLGVCPFMALPLSQESRDQLHLFWVRTLISAYPLE